MIDLMAIFICDKHGEILEDETEKVESIDTVNDEVYVNRIHVGCGQECLPKYFDGQQEFQSVSHERWLWAQGYFQDALP